MSPVSDASSPPLGHELLTSKASACALSLEPAELDSERFAGLVAEAAEPRAGGDPAAAPMRCGCGEMTRTRDCRASASTWSVLTCRSSGSPRWSSGPAC